MPSEAALDLSILELVQALNEKLDLECIKAREIRFSPALASVASLEAEVSGHRLIYVSQQRDGGI